MANGKFVVIEGVDGAGTTTHTKRLASALRGNQVPVHHTREPSDGPIGVLLRQILTRRMVVPGVSDYHTPSWQSMALLFAADRMDHLQAEIEPNLREGVCVISDRYDYSSVAYQTLSADAGPGAVEWVKEINRYARRPDLTLVLDVSSEVSAERRASRSAVPELYETDELQTQLAGFYDKIDDHFPGDRIVHIDGHRDMEEVGADILKYVLDVVGR